MWERRWLRQELRFYASAIEKHQPPDTDADLSQSKQCRENSYERKDFGIQTIARRRFEKENHRREYSERAKHNQYDGKNDGGNARPVSELQ
jgi:hypothetical protein